MGEILFLAHRIPFPPDRGDKIRSHHILRRLAELAPVHVACFSDDERDAAAEADLAAIAASHCLIERRKPLALAGVEAVLRRQPVSLTAFHHQRIADYVAEVIAARPIATIFVFSGQMGQYIPAGFKGRVVVDFVDADSAKFDAYAASGNAASRWINAREARLLLDEEARLARRADASLLVSHEEALLFGNRLSNDERRASRIRVLENGIDSQLFDPAAVSAAPVLAALTGPKLIFSGQMDYPPNVSAAIRAATRVMPRIREAYPTASLHIVGRKPAAEVKALDGVHGSRVWGRVDDMRCWLSGCDLALVPLEIARGVQNKVLEAMAMAMPVVASPGAATGIGAEPGRELAVADSDEELAAAAIALLANRDKAAVMGLAARRFLEDRRSWQATLAPLADLVGMDEPQVSHAA